MLAAAFIAKPEILFLDEPFINLDPIVQSEVREYLKTYVDDGGTVFLNTHLLENAERLCNRAAIIHNGTMQANIELEELKKQNLSLEAVSYTHRRCRRYAVCRSRWSPYH